jgi:hypothetical protein
VYFEILNEPDMVKCPEVWTKLENQIIPAIRKEAPHHTIVVPSGGTYANLHGLLASHPIPYHNIIYTFHDYDPIAFTNQGATFWLKELAPLSHIPYPSTPKNIAPKLGEEPTIDGRLWLKQYGSERWNASRINSEISLARKWSKRYHVPIWCGEFGAIRNNEIDPTMRAAWFRDMRVALEHNGIGWAMWGWGGEFALITDVNGVRVPDPDTVKALGLNLADMN